jgi:hypothetical protein
MLSRSDLYKLLLYGNPTAVSSSGSTVDVIGAAVPVTFRAASTRAMSAAVATLIIGSQIYKLLLFFNKRAVLSSGSTVEVVFATEPVRLRAASSRAFRSITFLLGNFHKLLMHGNKWAFLSSGKTVEVVLAAEPVSFRAASSRAFSSRAAFAPQKHLITTSYCQLAADPKH